MKNDIPSKWNPKASRLYGYLKEQVSTQNYSEETEKTISY
jgi:hypothetical protein